MPRPWATFDLSRRPLLCAMQDAQHPYFVLSVKDLIDCNEWQWRKSDFTRALDAARATEVRKALQSADALDDGLRHASCGLGTALSNVVADPFEVIRGVRRPADAH